MITLIDSITMWLSGAFVAWCWMGGWERMRRWIKSKRQKLTYGELLVREQWAQPFDKPRYGAFRYSVADIRSMVNALDQLKVSDRTWVWHTPKGLYVNVAVEPNIVFKAPPGISLEDDDL